MSCHASPLDRQNFVRHLTLANGLEVLVAEEWELGVVVAEKRDFQVVDVRETTTMRADTAKTLTRIREEFCDREETERMRIRIEKLEKREAEKASLMLSQQKGQIARLVKATSEGAPPPSVAQGGSRRGAPHPHGVHGQACCRYLLHRHRLGLGQAPSQVGREVHG